MKPPAERKREQRARDAKDGIVYVTVKVPRERAPDIKRLAHGMLPHKD